MTPQQIQGYFRLNDLPVPTPEYQFHTTRLWRFDYAWPEHKIAMEIDGGIHTGGRHVTARGYFNDMEKRNHAAMLGWRMLYITPKAVGTALMLELVRKSICKN